jgi:hypothetical protein
MNDTMRLQFDVAEHMPSIWGKFGKDEVCSWPVTFGQNEKGGMDDEEFEKYLMKSIVPLYPNAKDRPGKCVILKVDSGPGTTNLSLLTTLRLLGFVLYPCVPNTMHVTQETDQCYGPFKTQFLKNLEDIVAIHLKAKKSLSLQPKFVGLPLFGVVDRETGFEVEVADGAFQKGFRMERSLAAWKMVGAASEDGLITRACLDDPKFLRDLGDDGNTNKAYWAVQTANNISIAALKQAGYDANWLKAEFKRSGEEAEHQVTQPNTLARQQALANVCTHGGRFHASGGGTHLMCNDIFIAAKISSWQKDKDEAEREKKLRLQLQVAEEKALAIVEQGKSINKLTFGNLNALLDWHQVKSHRSQRRRPNWGGGCRSWQKDGSHRSINGGRALTSRGFVLFR